VTSPVPAPTRHALVPVPVGSTWQRESRLTYAQHHVHLLSIRHAKESLDLMRRVAEIARTRYASGLGGQQDALRAQTEIVAMETDLAMLEGESAQASARMRALLGRPENVKLRPPDLLRTLPPQPSLELKILEERLRANNPQLAAVDARIAGAEKNKALVELNRYPGCHARRVAYPGAQSRGAVGADVRDQYSACSRKAAAPRSARRNSISKPHACAARTR
jgi:hypothetical protein